MLRALLLVGLLSLSAAAPMVDPEGEHRRDYHDLTTVGEPSPPPAAPPAPAETNPLGYVYVLIASLFFGSNFVPVKRYETHDGMYYQWVMCAAIWMTGLFIQLLVFAAPGIIGDVDVAGANPNPSNPQSADDMIHSGRPDAYSVKFIPMACLGGALWSTGNTMSVPVINSIGLSLGLLIWGSANMLMGWYSGLTGLNGLFPPDELANPALNYVGVALAVVALGMYTQIKAADTQTRPLNSESSVDVHELDDVLLEGSSSAKTKGGSRLIGMLMAIMAGVLFGNTFTPPTWIKANDHGPSNDLDYIFSHFTGIFATSTVWFIVYCAIMKGSPLINNRLTLPAMLSGVMWAIAQTMWFLANTSLSVSVAFPMITSGPGIVSALWGVFAFGEISGTRNYVVLCMAIVTALTGCILIGLSKG